MIKLYEALSTSEIKKALWVFSCHENTLQTLDEASLVSLYLKLRKTTEQKMLIEVQEGDCLGGIILACGNVLVSVRKLCDTILVKKL